MDQDNVLAALLILHDFRPRPHIYPAAPGAIGLNNPGAAVDNGPCGKIRTWNVLHQFIDGQFGIADQSQTTADDFREIVGRDIRGHTHRNTGGAVDQ